VHVYVSIDRRGDQAIVEAERILAILREDPDHDPAELGDPFLLARYYGGKAESEIAALLGTEFAAELMQLEVGRWHGPIRSGYGLHVVRIDERVPARLPELAEIRRELVRELENERRERLNEELMQRLRQRYDIEISFAPTDQDQPAGS